MKPLIAHCMFVVEAWSSRAIPGMERLSAKKSRLVANMAIEQAARTMPRRTSRGGLCGAFSAAACRCWRSTG